MISLRTLHEFSPRTVFWYVARHLLRQNEKALDYRETQTSVCVYRAPDGKQCAVGCLIADDEYDPGMEQLSVTALITYINRKYAGKEPLLQPIEDDVVRVLDRLQDLHDGTLPANWPEELLYVAQQSRIPLTDDERRAILTRNLDHEAFIQLP